MVGINSLKQWNFAPVQPGRTHINGNLAIGKPARFEQPGNGLHRHIATVQFAHQHIGHTARGIATGSNFAAIIVANAHKGIGVVITRWFNDNKLVTAHPGFTIRNAGGGGIVHVQNNRIAPSVKDDKIVAQAMHLGKGNSVHIRFATGCKKATTA